jgi:hypothetical protein
MRGAAPTGARAHGAASATFNLWRTLLLVVPTLCAGAFGLVRGALVRVDAWTISRPQLGAFFR